jgi:hypothetical protein
MGTCCSCIPLGQEVKCLAEHEQEAAGQDREETIEEEKDTEETIEEDLEETIEEKGAR